LAERAYPRGSVVLVPFPFTDLSGRKRRPALVVSPDGFHEEDLILCAITSHVPEDLAGHEVLLEPTDMFDRQLPKRSVVKVGKLFTMHQRLIAVHFGTVKDEKVREVLARLAELFAIGRGERRTEEIDEAVLALLHLNAFEDHGVVRAWKGMPWEALDRLYERGLIFDPKTKAKSVVLTEEGRREAEGAFRRGFA
jgi:mRNA-degrading endonuclease toxin of MazEF toxin-antitoxin module